MHLQGSISPLALSVVRLLGSVALSAGSPPPTSSLLTWQIPENFNGRDNDAALAAEDGHVSTIVTILESIGMRRMYTWTSAFNSMLARQRGSEACLGATRCIPGLAISTKPNWYGLINNTAKSTSIWYMRASPSNQQTIVGSSGTSDYEKKHVCFTGDICPDARF